MDIASTNIIISYQCCVVDIIGLDLCISIDWIATDYLLVTETENSKLRQLPFEIVDLRDLRSSFHRASISDFNTIAEGTELRAGISFPFDLVTTLLCNVPHKRILITTADDKATTYLHNHIIQSNRRHNHHNFCTVYSLFEADSPHQHCYEISTWDQTGCTIVVTTSAVASYHQFTNVNNADAAVINFNAHTSLGTNKMKEHVIEYYKSNKYVKYLDEQEGLVDKMKRQYLKRLEQQEEERRHLAQQAEEKRRAEQRKQRQLALQAEERRRAEQRKQEQRQLERREEERRRAAWRRYNAATTIFCWWRRRQLENHFKKLKEESTAATIIFCWWRRKLLSAYFEKHRAARIIQFWNRRCMFRNRCKRRSIIKRRKQLKLEAAASSSALRDRGQPLPPINHRQRYRRKQRARRQRHSKRSRPSRKRGQHERGRPPNPTQPQQSQQQSIERRDNELGIALSNSGRSSIRGSVIGSVHNNSSELKTAGPYVLGRDLRRRDSNGRVTALGAALQSSELSSKESVIGDTLHGNESSSRGSTAETPQQDSSESHRSSTQPISSLKSKSSRRRRRRRRRRKHPRTNHHQKDEASTSKRHTPTYPSSDAHLSNISDLCDGIRRQLHQASSSDRHLLKFVCQLVLQTIDNQPTEPSIIDKIESPSTSTSVNNTPSSTTNNESFSSIKNVDSHTPKSTTTTKLTELPCSVSITTEETTTRHEKPVTYLHALIGTTSNFG